MNPSDAATVLALIWWLASVPPVLILGTIAVRYARRRGWPEAAVLAYLRRQAAVPPDGKPLDDGEMRAFVTILRGYRLPAADPHRAKSTGGQP